MEASQAPPQDAPPPRESTGSEHGPNDPHPGGPPAEEEDFFGADPNNQGAALDAAADEAIAADAEPAKYNPVTQEMEGGEPAPPPPPSEQPPQAPSPADPEPQPAPTPEAGKKGAVERDYRVFQEVPLTAELLQHLLDEAASSEEPRMAYFSLDVIHTGGRAQALRTAYATHREALPTPAPLVAISARDWEVKKLKPRERVQEALDIE